MGCASTDENLDPIKKFFPSLANYAYTIRDKVSENVLVMKQILQGTPNNPSMFG